MGGGEIKVNILRADLETMPEGFGGAISSCVIQSATGASLFVGSLYQFLPVLIGHSRAFSQGTGSFPKGLQIPM